jgi:hypothetical protein
LREAKSAIGRNNSVVNGCAGRSTKRFDEAYSEAWCLSVSGLFGRGAMSDLSPLCALKRTFANVSRLSVYARTNPHIAVAHEVFRGAQPVLNALGARIDPAAPPLRQINPTGKISLSSSGKSGLGPPPSCPRGRGVGHRHERWDGMRWTRQCRARDGMAGRASARERSQDVLTSDAEAYGEVVWS